MRPLVRVRQSLLGGAAALAMLAMFAPLSGARGTTLADAVALAYRTNPSLMAQREALKSLDESYVQSRAALGPQASVNAQLSNEKAAVQEAPSLFSPASTLRTAARTDTETLSVSQIIFNGGQSAAAINAAQADILAGREQLRAAEMQLVQQVINAFVGVRRDRELLAISQSAVDQLTEEESETEARFKYHDVTQTDLSQSKARLSSAYAELAAARSRLNNSQTVYLQYVGQNPDDLSEPPPLANVPATVDAAYQQAVDNSPTLKAAVFTELGSRARVEQERTAGNATLSANFNVTNGPVLPYDARYYQKSAAAIIAFNKPLFTSGLFASRIREAEDRDHRDRLQADAARRQTLQLVGQYWGQMNAADLVLKAQEDQVAAQRVAYDSVRAEYKAGLRETIEVLNAELELENARLALVQAMGDTYLARTALLAAMGTLRTDDISPGLKSYSPEQAFRAVANRGVPPWVDAIQALDSLHTEKPKPQGIHDPAGEVTPSLDLGPTSPKP
jgi:TolC family type I secretion outer membrane protein